MCHILNEACDLYRAVCSEDDGKRHVIESGYFHSARNLHVAVFEEEGRAVQPNAIHDLLCWPEKVCVDVDSLEEIDQGYRPVIVGNSGHYTNGVLPFTLRAVNDICVQLHSAHPHATCNAQRL